MEARDRLLAFSQIRSNKNCILAIPCLSEQDTQPFVSGRLRRSRKTVSFQTMGILTEHTLDLVACPFRSWFVLSRSELGTSSWAWITSVPKSTSCAPKWSDNGRRSYSFSALGSRL